MADPKLMHITMDETSNSGQAFMADGYERALAAIEAEVRSSVEQKYADAWRRSGPVKRWFLVRRMERDIAYLVAERSRDISPGSLY